MYLRNLLDKAVRSLATAILAGLSLAACSETAGTPPSPSFATGNQAVQRTYRLGVGDKLKITVFGEENLSGATEVNAMGQVALPLAGEIPAKGLAINQFRDAVVRRLQDGYLKTPKVTVEVTNYRAIYVHGEVKSAGEFPYKPGLTLRDAVAVAGGYTYRADQSFLLVAREGEPLTRIPLPSDVPVLPGDNLQIPERFF